MAKHYGGLLGDSADGSKATSRALTVGGTSGFNAMRGGNRNSDGGYDRLEAHGLYWAASDGTTAIFYNFGSLGLGRHVQVQRQMAVSVRCIKE